MPQPNSWTWSPLHNDHYRIEQLPNGTRNTIWSRSQGSPSSAPAVAAAAGPSTSSRNTTSYTSTNRNAGQLYASQPVYQGLAGVTTSPAPMYWASSSQNSTSRPRTTTSYNNPLSLAQGRQPARAYDFQSIGDESVTQAVSYLHTPFPELERLASNFRKIDPNKEWDFYKPGRVFKALVWATEGSPEYPSVVKYGERAYAKVYRFIVVKAAPKEHWSSCLRISTHGGKAATKSGLDQRKHTIVYTGSQAPSRITGEENMNKDPIRIIPVNSSEKLDPLSRVHLGKTYPMEHNIKVEEVGTVDPTHWKRLSAYWKTCQ